MAESDSGKIPRELRQRSDPAAPAPAFDPPLNAVGFVDDGEILSAYKIEYIESDGRRFVFSEPQLFVITRYDDGSHAVDLPWVPIAAGADTAWEALDALAELFAWEWDELVEGDAGTNLAPSAVRFRARLRFLVREVSTTESAEGAVSGDERNRQRLREVGRRRSPGDVDSSPSDVSSNEVHAAIDRFEHLLNLEQGFNGPKTFPPSKPTWRRMRSAVTEIVLNVGSGVSDLVDDIFIGPDNDGSITVEFLRSECPFYLVFDYRAGEPIEYFGRVDALEISGCGDVAQATEAFALWVVGLQGHHRGELTR